MSSPVIPDAVYYDFVYTEKNKTITMKLFKIRYGSAIYMDMRADISENSVLELDRIIAYLNIYSNLQITNKKSKKKEKIQQISDQLSNLKPM